MTTLTANKDFLTVLRERRSIYGISNASPIPDAKLEQIVADIVRHMPSAYNSQSTRLVLLLSKHHKKFWEIVEEVMQAVMPAESFRSAQGRLQGFRNGYGTVLFFEDQAVVEGFQQKFPRNQELFPVWSEQTNGMHQYAVWVALEAEGLGASLQHYNMVEERIKAEWGLPETWRMIAQMPFGSPTQDPRTKEVQPVEERMRVFR
ncbi:nitroreductase [Alicyclobacillus hesperidum]|uniref:Nitroreductase n=1 Tax=Alicyclobacillus hesperidum TaxID=89784 RepID=A0AA37X3A8_9BACL|nr:nitroreductase family protein [Alicyclobacillus hesperidum]GLV14720.1 nitroreductase [Alicyclobacillus hesperidum]